MKILILNHFPLSGSGSGTYTQNLAIGLAGAGHTVHILLPENESKFAVPQGICVKPIFFTHEERISGALPFNFPCFTSHPRSVNTFASLNEEERAAYIIALSAALEEEMKTFQPDIIHAQHVWVWPYLAAKYNTPCVITVHGTDLMGYKNCPEYRAMADIAAQNAKLLITISKDSDAQTAEILTATHGKRVLMHNGYDEDVFYPEHGMGKDALAGRFILPPLKEKLVLFAGKLTEFKGVDILLKAAKIYEDENISTLIAGGGALMETLRAQATKLGLKNLYFLGNRTPEELRCLYNAADVFAMPSRREPFGLVALEAMACGTPVVATGTGGLPDFITEEVGALVPQEDPEALAAAITAALNPPCGKAKRDFIAGHAKNNYSNKQMPAKMLALYQKVLMQTCQ